ncbi:MAG: PilZ domain-containing protein [Myxococcota bacterium]
MLEPLEIWANSRRALRRAVHLECDLLSEVWDAPATHLATNLSPYGIWVDATFPLDIGDPVVLAFAPPNTDVELLIDGTVRRAELRRRARDPRPSGMGIEFGYLSPADAELLQQSLRGLPPPLREPSTAPRVHRSLAWVDTLLTWEEVFEDRVNSYEVSELLAITSEDEFEIECLGELVSGDLSKVA